MIHIKIGFLLTLLVSFSIPSAQAQVEQKEEYLISILNKLQEKFGYTFSYVDHELKEVRVPRPENSLDLEASLGYLTRTTPFDFTILNESTIAVSLRNRSRKICGILLDTNGNPISGASITGGSTAATSNPDGRFTLTLNESDQFITVRYLGYQMTKLSVKSFFKEACPHIQIREKVEKLNEVFLTNYLTRGIDKNLDGSISIDYNNFGILPGLIEPDLLQTIQALPGILSVNETVSDINVRGGTQDQNLILWDGIKMYQSSHFFGLISAFNPYLTKNVTIYKNGSGVQYGDGVSSVISMNTSNEVNKKLDASVGANLISVDGYIDTPVGKNSSVQLAIRRSINDAVETWTYEQYFDKVFQGSEVINDDNSDVKFSFADASVRWLYQITPRDLLKVNGLIMRNNLVFKENVTTNQTNESKESSAKQNNIAGGISYKRIWNDVLESDILIYGTNYTLEASNSDISNDQRLLQINDVLESGLKTNTYYQLNPSYTITAGYQFNETGISNRRNLDFPPFEETIKEVVRAHSIFTEINYNSTEKNTNITIGGRLNYFEKFDRFLPEPRISFRQNITKKLQIEVLGELKSQTTSQVIDQQNDFLGIENRRWILSNEDKNAPDDNYIPIINSAQSSVGLTYKHRNWLINTDVYYKKVNGIITRSQGFQNQYEFIRDQGNYEVVGVDFLINKRFKNLGAWLSYSYADNQYTFNQLPVNQFHNNIDIRHNLNLAITYTLSNFKFSSGINWHTGKPFTKPSSPDLVENNQIQYESPNSSRLEDYFRLDASTTYKFPITKKIQAFAGISLWNILSRENTSNQFYSVNSGTITEVTENGLGFTPNAVFRITF